MKTGVFIPPEVRWKIEDTEQSIPSRFEQQVRLHPDKTAIDESGWQPTFSELNAAANRHAQALIARNTRPGSRIALLLPHDGRQIAAVLGVLKAGRIVVVLNPGDPASHLEKLRQDAEPALVITDDRHFHFALEAGFPRDAIVEQGWESEFSDANPGVSIQAGDMAALIQTSGSTGQPRSVMQTHRNILHNVLRIINGLGLLPGDRFALLASLSGGLGIATTWISLLNGATLCPFPVMENGFAGLAAWLMEKRISIYTSATSVFRHFTRTLGGGDFFPDLRLVRLGSEPVLPADFEAYRRHFAGTAVFANAFACSEAGNIAQCLLDAGAEFHDNRVPAGTSSEGITIHLIDEEGQEVPHGETGEIVIEGDHLSPGYWRNDALTAQRFTEGTGSARMFHTGDLGCLDKKNRLVVTGRKAARFKVHGYWVEPADIEAAILRQPGIESVVLLNEVTPFRDASPVAYMVPRAGFVPKKEVIAHALREALPSYMVPAEFVFVENFPLTPHGKIDRRALASMKTAPEVAEVASTEPRDALERTLHGLFSRTLPRRRFGITESFFDLGGDSLAAAELFDAMSKVLRVELPLAELKNHPSVSQLAARIRSSGWNLTDNPVVLLTPSPDERAVNFFMWPGAGSDAMSLSDLARHMGPAVALHAIQHRGADGRQVYDLNVADMAVRSVALIRRVQPAGPYSLCGTSFGGLIALETARLLRKTGEHVAFLGMLDTFGPGYPALRPGIGLLGRLAAWLRSLRPIGRKDEPGLDILMLGIRERIRRLRARKIVLQPDANAEPFSMAERFMPLQAASFIAIQAYHPTPYDGEVHFFRVDTPPPARLFIQDETLGWSPWFTGVLRVSTMPGTHGKHLKEPNVQVLAAMLREQLTLSTAAGRK